MSRVEFAEYDTNLIRQAVAIIQERHGLSGPKGHMQVTALILAQCADALMENVLDSDVEEWLPEAALKEMGRAVQMLSGAASSLRRSVEMPKTGL